MLHVVIGLGVLLFIRNAAKATEVGQTRMIAIKSGASFWHMVDLLWIVLFALLFALR